MLRLLSRHVRASSAPGLAQQTAETLVNANVGRSLQGAKALLSPALKADANRLLLRALGQVLSFNITLSTGASWSARLPNFRAMRIWRIASSPALQYNASNQFAPLSTDVTFRCCGNV
ncbi:hypothetical protein DOTSEDRAFT_58360 [Dothistroma septosporum NZE10]|uniref:Uncharacterized protein n=1 Tax=Dothistroma septosporum (strain NZE10 / CBS 128990) TaxID=675120 RepID=N1Q3Q2_DOTSN|nr:hypothetical protein DOTSEDRAFT_58360 [Dothistroma septosporum NZE10]